MKVPVTKTILALVTVLSLFSGTYHIWGDIQVALDNVKGAADGVQEEWQGPSLVVLVLRVTPWWAFWTLVTTGFVESEILPFLIFFIVAGTGGRYCERIWGSRVYFEFALTMLVATTFAETLFWAWFSSTPTIISGTNGLLAGIVVALKQLAPGHTIILLRNKVRVQIKWLPVIFLFTATVLQGMGLENNVTAYYFGFVGGWLVLRFFQSIDGVKGDASDAMAFASFFPQPLASWLESPLNVLYALFSAKLKLVPAFTAEDIEAANQRYVARLSGTVLPAYNRGPRATNERRKMMLSVMDKEL